MNKGYFFLWLLICLFNTAQSQVFPDFDGDLTNFSGPILINHGGTYSGLWYSDDSDMPAIFINTGEKVIIENSIIVSRGDFITNHRPNKEIENSWNVDVEIRNCYFFGKKPDKTCRQYGRVLRLCGYRNVIFEHNYLENTAGMVLGDYCGNSQSPNETRIMYNKSKNIRGLQIDDNGELIRSNRNVQFLQIFDMIRLEKTEIAWNEIFNYPDSSCVEDNINLYNTGGYPNDSINIHHNYIQGAYQFPFSNNTAYTGGGILLSDGHLATGWQNETGLNSIFNDSVMGNFRGKNGFLELDSGHQALAYYIAPDLNASAYVLAENNYVVSTTHYGIAIASGHDNTIRNNRIVSSGMVRTDSSEVSSIPSQQNMQGLESYAGIYSYANNFIGDDVPIGHEGAAYFDNNQVDSNQVRWNGYWDGVDVLNNAQHGRLLSDNGNSALNYVSPYNYPIPDTADLYDYEFAWNSALNDVSNNVDLNDEINAYNDWKGEVETHSLITGPTLTIDEIKNYLYPEKSTIFLTTENDLYTRLYDPNTEAVEISATLEITSDMSIEANQTFHLSFPDQGQYMYLLIDYYDDHYGCNVTASSTSSSREINETTIIEEEQLIVFPNPAFDILNINLKPNPELITWEIYNSAGSKISEGVLLQGEDQINISKMNSGLYFLICTQNNRKFTQKFIKK